METGMNTPITCNLLTSLLDDVITVTLYKSCQFNFSSHAKINHIEFEDKFLIKRTRMYYVFCQKTAERIF